MQILISEHYSFLKYDIEVIVLGVVGRQVQADVNKIGIWLSQFITITTYSAKTCHIKDYSNADGRDSFLKVRKVKKKHFARKII